LVRLIFWRFEIAYSMLHRVFYSTFFEAAVLSRS
jgi:hypothetical protein